MALLGSLFQLLSGCIGLKSVSQDAVKLFCVKFASQESLNGATKVAISDEIFLTTLKIAQSSGVVSVFSSSLLVVLHNISLGTSFDDIVMSWSNKLTDSKEEQDCRVMKEIKKNSTLKSELNKYGFNV
ncbi:hypothetical protein G9A89_012092 [Geosiphon pyriformis]|nr:hypothetical protein G9A89_012092 [Geosiphon pyriformis]